MVIYVEIYKMFSVIGTQLNWYTYAPFIPRSLSWILKILSV